MHVQTKMMWDISWTDVFRCQRHERENEKLNEEWNCERNILFWMSRANDARICDSCHDMNWKRWFSVVGITRYRASLTVGMINLRTILQDRVCPQISSVQVREKEAFSSAELSVEARRVRNKCASRIFWRSTWVGRKTNLISAVADAEDIEGSSEGVCDVWSFHRVFMSWSRTGDILYRDRRVKWAAKCASWATFFRRQKCQYEVQLVVSIWSKDSAMKNRIQYNDVSTCWDLEKMWNDQSTVRLQSQSHSQSHWESLSDLRSMDGRFSALLTMESIDVTAKKNFTKTRVASFNGITDMTARRMTRDTGIRYWKSG